MTRIPLKNTVLGLVFLAAASGVQVQGTGDDAEKALFESTCSKCHTADASWRGARAAKQWRELVTRMQGHAKGGPNAFSDGTAARMVAWLAGTSPSSAHAAASEAEPAGVPAATGSSGPAAAAAGDAPVSSHGDLHEVGAALGGAAAFCLAALIGSGLARRRLKRRFHAVHGGLSIAFGVVLGSHAVLLFLPTGLPRSLWHGCGAAALAVVVAAAAVGLGRRRIGRRFLPIHKTLAFAAVVLFALHRVLD